MASDPGSGQTARLKRWLLLGGAGAALLGGLWVVIHFTGPAPRGQRGEQTVGEILLTGDSRQTSLEALSSCAASPSRLVCRLSQVSRISPTVCSPRCPRGAGPVK